MLKKHPILALLFILALASMACNFPTRANRTPTPSGPDATFTALVETLQVAFTQTAQTTPQASETPTLFAPTLPPTSTAIPLPTWTPVPPTAIPCNWAQFISDVSVPDGSTFQTGQSFVKTWRLKNIGACNWNTGYAVVFDGGDKLSAPSAVNLPHDVAPGQTVDISVPMVAPGTAGSYKGLWKLAASSGAVFGIGGNANMSFWVQIKAEPPAGPTVLYNFYERTCDAVWSSNAGPLACPGGTGDNTGFVVKVANPKLETGVIAGAPAIETHPLWASHPQWAADGNGWIQGLFPGVNIKAGSHFKARIGCLDGAVSCDVNFYIQYSADGGPYTALGASTGYRETYDSSVRDLDFDLTALSGKTVEFLFQVDANSNPGQDWAVWVNPRIEK